MNELTVEVIESKIGVPALQVNIDGKNMMLHSKYNPIQEAERFIDSLKERIDEAEHVLFYGVGLGYHVRYFCEQYPEKLASTYEPIAEIASTCLKLQSQTAFPKEKLAHFLMEDKEDSLQENLQKLRELVHQKFVIITLPVYERLFPTTTESFSQSFRNFLLMVGNDMATVMEFSERWTINSIKNLPFTLESHSIFEKKSFFKGNPAIIVSAGPSLNAELSNLKYIKENGLAYIFAVGSANKILINNNVYPDAVCTYDPQQHNYKLFEEIYNNRIKSIPMIYATTVGHETLDQYSGPLFCFITTQDNLTQQLLEKQQKPVIYDAPSIAVITLQVLSALEVSKIILVGQNFAFKQDKFYADGIERFDKETQRYVDNTIQSQDEATIIEVEDVHKGKVRTNAHFQQMKADMETVLQLIHVPTINTTQGGAKIEGAKFKSLKAVIEEELTLNAVSEQWYQSNLKKQKLNGKILKQLEKDCSTFMSLFDEMGSILQLLKNSSEQQTITSAKFERLFNGMQNTLLYKLILNPILKMDMEKLTAKLRVSNKKIGIEERLKSLLEHYQSYLDIVLVTYKKIVPILQMNVFFKLNSDQKLKFYEATCGVFHYEGTWEKKWLELQETENSSIEIHTTGVVTKQQSSVVEFKFKGTVFQVIGSNNLTKPLKMKIIIDGKEQIITNVENAGNSDLIQSQVLFEGTKLTNAMHEIKIEVISSFADFRFLGVKINQGGQLYHIHEVERIEDLEVGKRIRYHYEASRGVVGNFSKSTVDTVNFLPLGASMEPNGDFYFIKVDGNKAIADRVIQNYISWDDLNKVLPSNGIDIPSCGFYTAPLYLCNDWDNFIKNDDFTWNFMNTPLTWGKECCNSDLKTRKFAVTVRGDIKLNRPKSIDGSLLMDGSGSIHRLSNYGFRPIILLQ